jgi:hypothetical protein
MTTDSRTATYELTIVGAIGPVLRWALRPHVAAQHCGCTIVRVKAADPVGVVEMVWLLDTAGFEVDSVAELGRR